MTARTARATPTIRPRCPGTPSVVLSEHAYHRLTATMPLFSRHGDPMLDQIARDTFALFPNCHRCGQRVTRFEDADVRVLVQRIVHRGRCPVTGGPDDGFDDGSMETSPGHATP